MNQEIHPEHSWQRTIGRQCNSTLICPQVYFELLNEDRPVLLVVGDGLMPNRPSCSLRLWLNRPLLTLLNKTSEDKFIWSPIWWRDDSEPYGKIMLWRDPPRGHRRIHHINLRMKLETVDLSFVSHRKGQLWFPVESIIHYAITQFRSHPHGLVFDPPDGFQR